MTSPDPQPNTSAPVIPAWGMAVAAGLAALLFAWFVQRTWRETQTASPYFANVHSTMGIMLSQKGQLEQSATHFRRAIELEPGHSEAWNNLGNVLLQQGKLEEALDSYRHALTLRPKYADAQNNLGLAMLQNGRLDEAIGHFHAALDLRPKYADAENNLGYALLQKGRPQEALEHFKRCIELSPGISQAYHNFALASFQLHHFADAADGYRKAIEMNSNQLGSLNNLAWILATCPDDKVRNGAQAVEFALRAVQITGEDSALILHTLAAAYAEAKRFNEALTVARRAFELAQADGNTELATAIWSQMQFYADARPYRETPPAPPAVK